MATGFRETTNTAWTLIGTGLSACLIQPSGDHYVHISNAAPTSEVTGLRIPASEISGIPTLAALGGGVWVRSVNAAGNVHYAAL